MVLVNIEREHKKMVAYSVLMSVYKNDNYLHLRQAIESVLEQTVPPDEVLIVCDGPLNNHLYGVLKEYELKFPYLFNVVKLKENMGLGKALQIGLPLCKNELIARMDADDIAIHNRMELQLKAFKNNDTLSLVGGQISEFEGNEDNIVGYRIVPIKYEEIISNVKHKNPVNHVTVMFKKSHVLLAGNYQDMDKHEDYYLWVRMILRGMFFENLPNTLVNVRVGESMYKRRGGFKYFYSEYMFQKYLLDKNIINIFNFFSNIIKRFVVQIILPNSLRGFVFKKFTREKRGLV